VKAASEEIGWLGQSIERFEDTALLTGRGRYIDDLATPPGTKHAAILRSRYAHAGIKAIRTGAARALKGVVAIITGQDVAKVSAGLAVGVRVPIQCWPIAVDRVRYVGEPVAVAVANDRYVAEDALDLIDVEYEAMPVVIDPLDSLENSAPILHEALQSNLVNERRFRYGDPEQAFAAARTRSR
jgi:2-furoyl-CoA dehydrogenase large subunit